MFFGKPGRIPALLWFFIGIIAPAPAFAYTVSFVILETGRVQAGVSGSANLWEDGLMDAFFNAGHIVSNAQKLRVNRETAAEFPNEVQGDIEEARSGGVDFLVVVLLDYHAAGEVSGTSAKPRRIILKVFSLDPYQKVYEQGYSGPMQDELTQAKRAAGFILSHLDR
jgi:hypothetical protein